MPPATSDKAKTPAKSAGYIRYHRCIVPTCRSTTLETKMFKFPFVRNVSEAWESILCSHFPNIEVTRSEDARCHKWCCILHFERKYLTKDLKRLRYGVPTLFNKSEIESGKPDLPIKVVWLDDRKPKVDIPVTERIASNPSLASTLHDHVYKQTNTFYWTTEVDSETQTNAEDLIEQINNENKECSTEIYEDSDKDINVEIDNDGYAYNSEMVDEIQEATYYIEDMNIEINEDYNIEMIEEKKVELHKDENVCMMNDEEMVNETSEPLYYVEVINENGFKDIIGVFNSEMYIDETNKDMYTDVGKEEIIKVEHVYKMNETSDIEMNRHKRKYDEFINQEVDEEIITNSSPILSAALKSHKKRKTKFMKDTRNMKLNKNRTSQKEKKQTHVNKESRKKVNGNKGDSLKKRRKIHRDTNAVKEMKPDIYDPIDRIKKKFINVFSGLCCGLCIDACDELEPVTKELDITGLKQTITIRYLVNAVFHNDDVLASECICKNCLDKLIQSFTFIYTTKTVHEVLSKHVHNLSENISTCSKQSFPNLDNLAILLDSTNITKYPPEANLFEVKTDTSTQSINGENSHICPQNEILPIQEELGRHKETEEFKTKQCRRAVFRKEYYLALQSAVTCKLCSEMFPESDIKEHLRNSHMGVVFECDFCDELHYNINSLDTGPGAKCEK